MEWLRNALQSASNTVAGNVAGPVDLLTLALQKVGVPVPENSVGSTQWMREQGLYKDVPMGADRLAGETAGLLSPIAVAAKAPQIARGLLQAGDNIAAPNVVNVGGRAGQRGIFMGDLSKTWNKEAAEKAMQMEKAGADPRAIWQETGTFKGADGKWRQEIDDSGARIDHPMPNIVELRKQSQEARTLEEAKKIGDEFNTWMDMVRGSPAATSLSVTNRPDIGGFKHAGLLDAYPEGQPRIWWENIGAPKGGSYDEAKNRVSIGLGSYADPVESKSIALHELQHAIQDRQGWARGGSPGAGERAPFVYGVGKAEKRMKQIEQQFETVPYLSKQYDDLVNEYESLKPKVDAEAAMEGYRRLAGEAEARAVQARMNMTPEQRRAVFPFDSYDVPVNSLIVR